MMIAPRMNEQAVLPQRLPLQGWFWPRLPQSSPVTWKRCSPRISRALNSEFQRGNLRLSACKFRQEQEIYSRERLRTLGLSPSPKFHERSVFLLSTFFASLRPSKGGRRGCIPSPTRDSGRFAFGMWQGKNGKQGANDRSTPPSLGSSESGRFQSRASLRDGISRQNPPPEPSKPPLWRRNKLPAPQTPPARCIPDLVHQRVSSKV